jgi:glycosyltransferase involved in cell wall biosynthesis
MEASRVAFLLPNMRGGGAERVALRLIGDFLDIGCEVDLVLLHAAGELMPLVPSAAHVVDLDAPRIRSAVFPLARYLRERNPSALQASMWPLTTAAVIARAIARSRTRLVLSEHVMLSRQYAGFGRIGRTFLGRSIAWSYPKADARVAVSERVADDLTAISRIDRGSIDVIYNPVAGPPLDIAPPEEIKAMWNGAADRIITVGSLKAQKNHAMLIRAFALLRKRRNAKLMILGEGELREPLRALAAERGVAEDVLFAGFTTDPWPYYESATAFALSSDYEGYPLVLIEAMRCGLPVVSTDCESGPAEILAGGLYGKLTPVGDAAAFAEALEQTLTSRPSANELKARAEALSGETTSARYVALMLGSPNPREIQSR